MSIAQLDTLYTAAVAAIDSGNFDAAVLKLMAIKARLATTPNLTKSMGGGGSQSITWNAAEIDSLIAQCRQMKTAAAHAFSGPFQQVPMTYARPESVEDWR